MRDEVTVSMYPCGSVLLVVLAAFACHACLMVLFDYFDHTKKRSPVGQK